MTSSPLRITGLTKMAAEIKNFSWENTSLGPISDWDRNLIVHTNMILSCPFPMMIWWGEELIQLHNDASNRLIGDANIDVPRSLGQRANQFWPDAWEIISEKLEKLKTEPLGVFEEDQLIPIYRNGNLEHVYWTFSYSQLFDNRGDNSGILIIFKETSKSNTELRQKREREKFLLDLTDKITRKTDISDIYNSSSTLILKHFFFCNSGFIRINERNNNYQIINSIKDEDYIYSIELNTILSFFIGQIKMNLSSDTQIYRSGKYSICLQKISLSGDSENETFFYAVASDTYDWNQYKLNTIFGACKRIGEIISIAEYQRKLVISESRYRSLFDNILDAFMVIDFIFDKNGKPINYTFVSTNPAFEVQSGLKNVTGKTILEIMPDVENEWIEAYGSVAMTGSPIQFNQYNEGTKRYYEVFASSVKEYPSQVVVVFRDVTEKKKEVERKKKFLNLASHELKTPLTTIYGYLQIVQKLYKGQNYQKAEALIEKSVTNVNRMATMINGFLHLSKIEDSIEPFRKELFNISDLVQECCREAVNYYSTHKINFLNSGCHNVNADRKRIMMVLQNLISNAVQYSPKGSLIKISCFCSKTEVNIHIEDEGIGISKDEMENIFKKFYRINDNPVTGISGFGLGLYISSEILKQHDSEIKVKDKSGKGSIFSFTLPL